MPRRKPARESFDHDTCPQCGKPSQPAENVPDQSFRYCPTCLVEWFEDLNTAPRRGIWIDNPGDTQIV